MKMTDADESLVLPQEGGISRDPSVKSMGTTSIDSNDQGTIGADGSCAPPTPEQLLQKINKLFTPMPDDVMIMAFPRSGSHWVHEMVWMLTRGTTDSAPIKEDHFLDMLKPEEFDQIQCPRILNTHYPYPTKISKIIKDTKVIYITREPRDVIVSNYNAFEKHRKSWIDFFDEYMEALKNDNDDPDCCSWFLMYQDFYDYLTDSEYIEQRSIPVLELKYGDMKLQPFENVLKIANYLGVNRSQAFLQEVVQKTDFKVMKKANAEIKDPHFVDPWGFSPEHYHKGVVGDWKNWFTVAQAQEFQAIYDEKMNS